MAEWFKAAVPKTEEAQVSVSSNLTLSAIIPVNAGLAHLVERGSCKAQAAGSSPATGTILGQKCFERYGPIIPAVHANVDIVGIGTLLEWMKIRHPMQMPVEHD